MKANIVHLGTMEYRECVDLQQRVLEKVSAGVLDPTLLLVEHDPVLTLGASFHAENLILSKEQYASRGIAVYPTDRGGDVTYHGPNQLVAYPIFDVARLGKDLHRWLRDIEEVVMRTVAEFGIEGYRFPPNTGVWVNERKIAAIGIKIRRWVSMHGLALNCNNDLSPFELIVPCGIKTHGVTSISRELGREVTVSEVAPKLVEAFAAKFEIEWSEVDPANL
jgi:lipoyl(octanoyl) transferase